MVQALLGISRLRGRPTPPTRPPSPCATSPTRPAAPGWRRAGGGGPVIGSLRGTVLDRGTSRCCSRSPGVGYRVTVTPPRWCQLEPGEVFCWSTTTAGGRPDALRLHQQGRAHLLRGAPRRPRGRPVAGAGHPLGPLAGGAGRILAEDDLAALCLVPGVGKKTAARLLIELKSRLDVPDLGDAPAMPPGNRSRPASARADVREALAGLGYSGPRSARPWRPAEDVDADAGDSCARRSPPAAVRR
jgi:holliday junction DNA helicase RuvA